MINFLAETIEKLNQFKLTPKDVCWVGILDKDELDELNPDSEKNISMTWDTFKKNADFEYDNGVGMRHINLNLIVVGSDWWLERHDYDGSEWWEFKKLPVRPKEGISPAFSIHLHPKDLD